MERFVVRGRVFHRLARGGALAFLCLVLTAPSAAALPAFTVSLGEPSQVVPATDSVLLAAGAKLSDGRSLIAYWHTSGGPTVLTAEVVGSSGAVVGSPVDLVQAFGPVVPLSVAPDDQGNAVVLWLETSGPYASYFNGTNFSTSARLDFAGLAASACSAVGKAAVFTIACDTTAPPPTTDSTQIRIGDFPIGAAAPSGSLRMVPATIDGNHQCALAFDSASNVWIAFHTPTPGAVFLHDLYLIALDPAGVVVFGPARLAEGINATFLVALEASATLPSAVLVARTEVPSLSPNAEVKVSTFAANQTALPPPAVFPSEIANVTGLALVPSSPSASSPNVVEWAEDRQGDHSPSDGAAHPRPVVALFGDDLVPVFPFDVERPLNSSSATFVRGSGALLEYGAGAAVHTIAFHSVASAGPNPPASPSPLDPILAATVVTLSVGAGVGVALNERLRWGLLVAFWPLYAALRREKVLLDNMRRGAILQIVSESPGIRFTDLSRRTGISIGALRHHIAVLEEFGFVSRTASRNSVRLYLAGKNPIREEPFKEIREQILGEIRKAPGLTLKELAEKVGVKWSTLFYHAQILEESGAVHSKRQGKTRRYWPSESQ